MEDLKFPEGKIPQGKPEKLSMDQYLEFVLFNRKNFPEKSQGVAPASERFVIREDEEPFSGNSHKA